MARAGTARRRRRRTRRAEGSRAPGSRALRAEHPRSRDEKGPSSGPARTDSPPSAWAAKYQSPCAFDNALERRYLALAVWRSFTSTPIASTPSSTARSEEHTSELQSQSNLVCRLLLEKKKKHNKRIYAT